MAQTSTETRPALRAFMAIALALMFAPTIDPAPTIGPAAAWADDEAPSRVAQADGSDAPNGGDPVEQLLAAGDYVEGEALVIMDNTAAGNGLRSRSVDLLAFAQTLMGASGETFASATGESLAVDEPAADGTTALRSAEALPAADTVAIALIRQEGMSTEDILRALQDDPRVLLAEPNYTYTLEDPDRASQAVSEESLAAMRIELEGSAAEDGETAEARALLSTDRAITAEDGEAPEELALLSTDRATAGAAGAAIRTGAAAAGESAPALAADLSSFQWGCDNQADTLVDAKAAKPQESGFDINPPDWNTEGQTNAAGVVAVMDTGIDYNHPDLDGVMCDMEQYPGLEKGGRYGYDAVAAVYGGDTADPMDDVDHGTHCAGIIAAEWDGHGTSGVASGVQLVAVKVLDADGNQTAASTVAGYEYLAEAVDNGLPLKAINNSWGNAIMSEVCNVAVTKLGEKGVVSLFAAGNDARNLDTYPGTAAALAYNSYVVTVDASASTGELAWFSNYGASTTDVVAPGESILSTVPLDLSTYFPAADAAPLSFDTFDGEGSGVKVRKAGSSPSEAAPLGGVVQGESRFDASGGSYKVACSDMGSSLVKRAGLTIPVPERNRESACWVGLSLLADNGEGDAVLVGVKVKNGEGETWAQAETLEYLSSWQTCSFNASELAQNAGAELAYTDDGELQLQLVLLHSSSESSDALYLDAVGVGGAGSTVAYSFFDGTSMAAPMAAGAAMVLAQQIPAEGAPAERAAALAALVKATVRPVDAFADRCSSGGHVDLAYAQQSAERTPVVSGARVEPSADGERIVVEGWHFGASEGTVTVGGLAADVISWSDRAITVACPADAKSGVLVVEVTAANGRSGKKGFLLDIPQAPGSESAQVFESAIPLPSAEIGFPDTVAKPAIVGYGGSLYLFAGEERYEATIAFSSLFRYDLAKEEWTRCADLPETLEDDMSLATHGGRLYAYGQVGEGSEAQPRLFGYDQAADSWEKHDASSLPLQAAIANCDGTLLLVGGMARDEDYGGWERLDKDNIVAFDPAAETAEPVGALIVPCSKPVVAVRGAELYVAQRPDDPQDWKSLQIERVTKQNGAFASELVGTAGESLLPELAEGYPPTYAMAAAKGGVVLTGLNVADDEDTFLLDPSSRALALKGLGKRASLAPLFYPSATAYDGQLYVAAISTFEPDTLVLRATPMETLPQAGDLPKPSPEPEPAPEPSAPQQQPADSGTKPKPLARTGDPLAPPIALLALTAAGALAATLIARRTRR